MANQQMGVCSMSIVILDGTVRNEQYMREYEDCPFAYQFHEFPERHP